MAGTHEQKARDIVVAHYTGATDGASERLYDAIATALRATEAAAWKAGAEAIWNRRLATDGEREKVASILDKLCSPGAETMDDGKRLTMLVLAGRDAARLLREPAGEGWQPIETAPKDGTPFLVGWRKGGWNPAVAHWEGEPVFFQSGGSVARFSLRPSHWCPLPAPPEGEGNG